MSIYRKKRLFTVLILSVMLVFFGTAAPVYADDGLPEDAQLQHVGAKDATCEEGGNAEYWFFTNEDGETLYFLDEDGTLQAAEEDIFTEALGHEWGEDAEYIWSEDCSEVTAEVHCTRDYEHVLTETVKADIEVITEPRPERDGEALATAVFKNEVFMTQHMIIELPATDDEVWYYNIEGLDMGWNKGSGENLRFGFKRSVFDDETIDRFMDILVDGNDVDPSDYDVTEGSVFIELHSDYLETLEVGDHTLTAVFDDGECEAEFGVLPEEEPVEEPEEEEPVMEPTVPEEEPEPVIEPEEPEEPEPEQPSEEPEEQEAPQKDTPANGNNNGNNVPKTGDSTDAMTWILMLTASLAGLGGLAAVNNKRQ